MAKRRKQCGRPKSKLRPVTQSDVVVKKEPIDIKELSIVISEHDIERAQAKLDEDQREMDKAFEAMRKSKNDPMDCQDSSEDDALLTDEDIIDSEADEDEESYPITGDVPEMQDDVSEDDYSDDGEGQDSGSEDEEFVPERILDFRIRGNKIFYEVKWQGLSLYETTWEEEEKFMKVASLEMLEPWLEKADQAIRERNKREAIKQEEDRNKALKAKKKKGSNVEYVYFDAEKFSEDDLSGSGDSTEEEEVAPDGRVRRRAAKKAAKRVSKVMQHSIIRESDTEYEGDSMDSLDVYEGDMYDQLDIRSGERQRRTSAINECNYCKKVFHQPAGVTVHQSEFCPVLIAKKMADGTYKELTCEGCGKNFRGPISLDQHRKKACDGPPPFGTGKFELPFTCPETGKLVRKEIATGRILEVTLNRMQRMQRCETCGDILDGMDGLDRHQKYIHEGDHSVIPPVPLVCVSGYIPENAVKLKPKGRRGRIIRKYRLPKELRQRIRPFKHRIRLPKRSKRSYHVAPDMCHICKEDFDEDVSLSFHIYDVHSTRAEYQAKQVESEYCEEVETETGKKFKCKKCDALLTKSSSVLRHKMSVHDKYMPVPCDLCDQTFESRRPMLEHRRRVHTFLDEPEQDTIDTEAQSVKQIISGPDKCHFCAEEFEDDKLTVEHIFAEHRKPIPLDVDLSCFSTTSNKFVCTLCESRFSVKEDARRHKLVVHDGIKLNFCDQCDWDYTRSKDAKRDLLRHRRNMHKNLPEAMDTKEVAEVEVETEADANNPSLNPYELLEVAESKVGPTACRICRTGFTTDLNCCRHIESVHGMRSTVLADTDDSTIEEMSENSFKCMTCGKVSSSKESAKVHKAFLHDGVKIAPCDFCDASFKDRFHLLVHRRQQHPKDSEIFKKMKTEKKATSKNAAKSEPKNKVKCTICELDFKGIYRLCQHLVDEHSMLTIWLKEDQDESFIITYTSDDGSDKQLFMCRVCSKKDFTNKDDVRKHRFIKHENDLQIACDVCKEKFPSHNKIILHRRENHIDFGEVYMCEECGHITTSKASFVRHKASHSFEDMPCSQADCTYVAHSKSAMRNHLLHHHEIGVYTCEACGTICKKIRDIKHHKQKFCQLNLEEGQSEKPYCCIECTKRFRTYVALQKHTNESCPVTIAKKIEDGTYEDYECENCGLRFPRATSLRYHHERKACDGPEPLGTGLFSTPFVDQVTGRKVRREIATGDIHSIPINRARRLQRCDSCGDIFDGWKALERHIKYVHGGDHSVIPAIPLLCVSGYVPENASNPKQKKRNYHNSEYYREGKGKHRTKSKPIRKAEEVDLPNPPDRPKHVPRKKKPTKKSPHKRTAAYNTRGRKSRAISPVNIPEMDSQSTFSEAQSDYIDFNDIEVAEVCHGPVASTSYAYNPPPQLFLQGGPSYHYLQPSSVTRIQQPNQIIISESLHARIPMSTATTSVAPTSGYIVTPGMCLICDEYIQDLRSHYLTSHGVPAGKLYKYL